MSQHPTDSHHDPAQRFRPPAEPPRLPVGDVPASAPVAYTPPPAPVGYAPAPAPQSAASGCKWVVLGGLGCLGLLILPIVAALVLGVTSVTQVSQQLLGIFQPQPARAVVETTPTIVNSVRDLGQLVSISVQVAKADLRVGIQDTAPLNVCGYAANHVAQGAIEAGIDLTRVSEGDVLYDAATNTYTLRLPPPQLTSCRVDYIRQYDRTTTACAVDWDEARLIASYTALVEFRDDAVEGGILEEARENARAVVTGFVGAVTGANVVVQFTEGASSSAPGTAGLPASCAPEAPQGWYFDPGLNAWVRG
jgi:hypothetical protein